MNTMLLELKHILSREHIVSQEPHFLTVIGPSGSGKSSVVMAGLLPRLQKGSHPPATTRNSSSEYIPGSDRWTYLIMRPGTDPVRSLAETLIPLLPVGDRNMDTVLTDLQDETTRALHLYAANDIAAEAGKRVVLVVDQFEELFTESSEADRQQFIDLLAMAATEPENKVIVIITLRADFSDQVMKSSLPYRMIEAHRIPIPPMTVKDLRAVIEEPAKLPDVGVGFDANLVGELLHDIRGREENLPLLQFTLDKLFQERWQHDNTLTLEAYNALGRVHGALSKHAKETYESLPSDEHRRCAEILFTRLINPGSVEQDATRRRVPKNDFTYDDPQLHRQMQETIRTFIDARLLTANEVTTANLIEHTVERIPTYEISHEALISEWQLLRDWISKAREDILTQQNLDATIEQWQKQQKSARRLYTGDQLLEAQVWSKRNIPNAIEKQFIKTSMRKQRNQSMLRVSAFITILSVLLFPIIYPTANLLAPYFVPTIVTNLQDSGKGSLRQVIQDAPSGSTITFAPSLKGTILLKSGDLTITKDLTLSGPGPNILSISNGKALAQSYHVHVLERATVTFKNISFSNSEVQQSSFIENEGNLTIDNCIIDHNISYYQGGGIYSHGNSQTQAQLAINNSSIYDNQAIDNSGGGIANVYGSLTITNSKIWQNKALEYGGGIYSEEGQSTLTYSQINNNRANDNGGGIYSLNSSLTLTQSQVMQNQTTSNQTSSGGGITAVGAVLELNSSSIASNKTNGYGGGLALLGGSGFIDQSTIKDNHANKGGGLAVEKDSQTNYSGLAVITRTEVSDQPKGSYYIGDNSAPVDRDILGKQQDTHSDSIIINEDASEPAGGPAPLHHPPEASPEYRGTVNLDQYCHSQGLQWQVITSEDMYCVSHSDGRVVKSTSIDTNKACQWATSDTDVIAQLADYYDPSSWQCYVHEQRLGGIVTYLNSYCYYKYGTGLSSKIHENAYNWQCLDQNNAPVGISITDACQWHYSPHSTDAFDVLTNFSDPDGWECWAPKTP